MIQRVQTLHLLAVVVLMTTLFCSTLAQFINADGIYTLTAMGVKSIDGEVVYPTIYLAIMVALTTLLPLITIFLFKNRMLQIRLCVVQIIFILGTIAMLAIYLHLGNRFFEDSESTIRIVSALPIVALLFDYLALRAIFKDELLIKSLDRIR